MNIKIVITALFLLLSQITFSAPKPSSCPSVSAILQVGITRVEKTQNVWYAGVLSNSFGTHENWTLTIGPITANSGKDARQKALTSLSSLTFKQGPLANGQHWVCVYNNPYGYTTGTITPALSVLPTNLN